MKKFAALALTAALLLTVSGCSNKGKEENTDKERTLIVSTWGLSEDVLVSDIFSPFEKICNCKVVLETGTTGERYTKLANDPNSTVDVIELSQSAAANGYAADLFEKIDRTKVPNIEDLIDGAKSTVEMGYGPAHTVNSIGIIYDKDAVGFEIKEWADLWKPELKGKISLPDIGTTFGPAMIYMANDYAKGDIKADQGAAAFKALEELKPNIVKTYSKSADLANMFSQGEIAVAVVGDFGIPVIQKAAPQTIFTVPASGTYANFNTIDINKNSKNKDLAYQYMNWRISSELQKTTANTLNEGPTNSKVVLNEEEAKNKTYGDVAANAKAVDYSFVNPLLKQWTDLWNRTLNN